MLGAALAAAGKDPAVRIDDKAATVECGPAEGSLHRRGSDVHAIVQRARPHGELPFVRGTEPRGAHEPE